MRFAEQYYRGREILTRKMRAVVQAETPHFLELVEQGDGAAYSEPFLFAHFFERSSSLGLEQILYGYIPEGLRPSAIPVQATESGAVYLPRVGWLQVECGAGELMLCRQPGGRDFQLMRNGARVPHVFRPVEYLADTEVEVCQDRHPALARLLTYRGAAYESVEITAPTQRHLASVQHALVLIRQATPWIYEEIARDCRKLVIVEHPQINSMASLAVHGAVFLSARPDSTSVFFAEDLIHQCGHVTFAYILADARALLTIPGKTPVATFTNEKNDHRTLAVAFHGNYTLAKMACFFDRCFDVCDLSEQERHELLGRFSLTMQRLKLGLEIIGDERLYTPSGLSIHEWMISIYESFVKRHGALWSTLQVANQPYVFDYELFSRENPLDIVDHSSCYPVG